MNSKFFTEFLPSSQFCTTTKDATQVHNTGPVSISSSNSPYNTLSSPYDSDWDTFRIPDQSLIAPDQQTLNSYTLHPYSQTPVTAFTPPRPHVPNYLYAPRSYTYNSQALLATEPVSQISRSRIHLRSTNLYSAILLSTTTTEIQPRLLSTFSSIFHSILITQFQFNPFFNPHTLPNLDYIPNTQKTKTPPPAPTVPSPSPGPPVANDTSPQSIYKSAIIARFQVVGTMEGSDIVGERN